MRLLVTRPEPDAQSTADKLAAIGVDSLLAPMMLRQTIAARFPSPSGFAALALTSTNALRALEELGILPDLIGIPVFAVGERTANAAKALGFGHVTTAEGTLDTLVTAIALARLSGPVLYPAGKHLSGDLARALAPHGLMVVTVTVYDMVAQSALPDEAAAALEHGSLGGALIYSRRTAEIFAQLAGAILPPARRRGLPMLCLSENVASALIEQHFSRVLLADHPSEEAMMALALAFSREQTGS